MEIRSCTSDGTYLIYIILCSFLHKNNGIREVKGDKTTKTSVTPAFNWSRWNR